MTAPDGSPVNAIRGLMDMIARLVRAWYPDRLVACMDADWRPAFRVAAIRPTRRTGRVRTAARRSRTCSPPRFRYRAGARRRGRGHGRGPGYEADDVIGTLTARGAGPVEMVTGDRDLFQLVDDARPVADDLYRPGPVQARHRGRGRDDGPVRDPRAGLRRLRDAAGRPQRRPARGRRAWGQDGGRAGPDVRLCRGHRDASTRATAASRAGTRAKLEAARDYLEVARAVVRVATDAPVPEVGTGGPPVSPADPGMLADLDPPLRPRLVAAASRSRHCPAS